MPKEVIIEAETVIEQVRRLQQLDEEDKQIIFRLIDKMQTNKKVKDFFAKHVATLLNNKATKNLAALLFKSFHLSIMDQRSILFSLQPIHF